MTLLLVGSALALAAWLCVLVVPHQSHRVRERLEAGADGPDDLSGVTAIIPARDEAALIGQTLSALGSQGRGLEVVVVDDQSSDDTRGAAARAAPPSITLRVIDGRPLPDGWAGKLWALEQGLAVADRPHVLLLDADIELAPHAVPALLEKLRERDATLVSLMAELNSETFWERLLSRLRVLLQAAVSVRAQQRRNQGDGGRGRGLHARSHGRVAEIGGFAAIRGALIDDARSLRR
jgi:glycosyltransferase involved in cell wall biosynthesis